MFTILTGENDTSLHVGIKMGCQVLQVEERSFYDAATGETRTRPQALVKTDCGLRGKISMHEVTDERVDENNFDMHNFVQAGQRLLAVVVGVDKFRQNLDLSIKPALLREEQDYWIKQRNYNRQVQKWFGSTKSVPMHDLTKLYMPHFNEEEALRLYRDALAQASGPAAGDAVAVASGSGTKRSGGGRVANQRHIIHQLFVNCGHAEAEERLCATLDDGAVKYDGNVIVRPSSKGVDSLSITWAFNLAARQFMHFEVEERGKAPGSLGLGNELYIKYGGDAHSNEPYSDLDEIYIRFIDPLNDFAALMSKYKHFREGTAQEVEEYLAVRQQEEPGKVPYCIRYETNMPGCYVLTWYSQKSSNPIKRAKITLLPTGYEMEKRTFARPSDIIDFLKQHVGGQAPPKKRSSASSGARRSRFSDR